MTAGPFWATTLRRWNAVCWVLYGLFTAVVAVFDRPGPAKVGTLALLGLLAGCYALVLRYRVLPHLYLGVLALSLSGLAYLRDGYAALFIVTLPHFWALARSWHASVAFSGLGAAGTLVGSTLRVGWSAAYVSSTITATLIVYAASVLIGVWVLRVVEESHERARVIAELEETQARLAAAYQRQGAADERERMARDIHDTLAQGLASIVVLAEAARSGLDPQHRSVRQLRSIEATARENLAEARDLVGADRRQPHPIADTLRRTLDRFTEDTRLTVVADLADVDLDQPTRIALLRCTQESLANVRKHARASTVSVTLAPAGAEVELEITDDGVGFAVDRAPGFGLDGMRKRLAELGGELTVTSSPGDGTRILAIVPAGGHA
ncbi:MULTISPECIES: sensor histidine kinase [Dactylosporangium]|uniref:Oxygen sensor histidine kinase NreB n=2 Tax=Dactylosporangium TaxID=35753 RepID=A0A9W6KIH4_9ACTN|nr:MULTISPECIES: sensor histidine kinase [Dactylosporangium]UAC01342.1 sensor histidine kinase [Dactylosporangium vinaceum]UWZ48891.1 sensor histidine kinase [Dactylosporangium matsuzakiense]GLL00891.1 hypothetical protein GCM10017581_026320 [Dactylosporangium matsuzakiense]